MGCKVHEIFYFTLVFFLFFVLMYMYMKMVRTRGGGSSKVDHVWSTTSVRRRQCGGPTNIVESEGEDNV